MKYYRVPNNNVYDIYITIILAIVIVISLYTIVPNNNYRLYLLESKNNA
jgi:hypothetical protein